MYVVLVVEVSYTKVTRCFVCVRTLYQRVENNFVVYLLFLAVVGRHEMLG